MTTTAEELDRVARLLGPQGVEQLAHATVLVVGLGAVGSFAVEALARSGIGMLCLVDGDRVEATNINRQLYALTTTIGEAKVEVAAARVATIAPRCRVVTKVEFMNAANADQIFDFRPDVVIDAIDIVRDKVSLICAALSRGIPLVSSMGAARRCDATRVSLGNLNDVTGCPLARQLRRLLCENPRWENGWHQSLRVVYSSERPLPLAPCAQAATEGVQRAMGSIVTVTGTFGLVAAGEAIRLLLAEKA